MLGLPGTPYQSPLHSIHSVLIHTAGIDLVLIGSIVLYAAADPINRKAILIFNAVGRLLFAVILGGYILFRNVIVLIGIFAVIDVFISIVFLVFSASKTGFTDN